jgi:hypothetical protein
LKAATVQYYAGLLIISSDSSNHIHRLLQSLNMNLLFISQSEHIPKQGVEYDGSNQT